MSRVAFHPRTAAKVTSQVRGTSRAAFVDLAVLPHKVGRQWAPSLALWGAGAGIFALYVSVLDV